MLVTLAPIYTLFAMVEEGSVVRAAQRRRLGQSTVTSQIKMLEEELGGGLFERTPDGLVPTTLGIKAYVTLSSVYHQANAITDYVGDHEGSAVQAILPTVAPGAAISRAIARASIDCAYPGHSEHFIPRSDRCLVTIDYASGEIPEADKMLSFRDRWVVVHFGTRQRGAQVRLDDLRGRKIHLPMLPADLSEAALLLGDLAGADIEITAEPHQLLISRNKKRPGFTTMMPAGMLNPILLSRGAAFAFVEPSAYDPHILARCEHAGPAAEVLDAIRSGLTSTFDGDEHDGPTTYDLEPLSLRLCRSFVALYEEGNVRKAAQRMCVVQPAVTVQLRKIETYVGKQLFERAHHGLVAEPVAHDLYGRIKPLVQALDGAVLTLRADAEIERSVVRIGLMPALDEESLLSEAFAIALETWSRQHPGCTLKISEGPSRALVDEVQAGFLDFALTDRKFADASLSCETLLEDSLVAVAHEDSSLLPPGPIHHEDLAGLPLVLPSHRHGLHSLIAHWLPGGAHLLPQIEVDSLATALSIVNIAKYVTILPLASVYKSSSRRVLSIHELTEPVITRSTCMASSREHLPCDAARDLMNELNAAFARLGAAFDEKRMLLLADRGVEATIQ